MVEFNQESHKTCLEFSQDYLIYPGDIVHEETIGPTQEQDSLDKHTYIH